MRRPKADGDKAGATIIHPLATKKEVAILEPFMVRNSYNLISYVSDSNVYNDIQCQTIHNDPLCSIAFRDDAIVTADRQGCVKIWARPKPTTNVVL
jgi:hypothetical protein